MSDTFHLLKRGDVWHYYRRVPTHLVNALGKKFIKRSLGVTNKVEAKSLRTIEDLKVDALFASFEKQDSSSVSLTGGVGDVSLSVLTEHVRKTVLKLDKKNASQFLLDPPDDNEVLHEMQQSSAIELGILQDLNNPQRTQWAEKLAKDIFSDLGVNSLPSETNVKFMDVVRRALIELNRRKIDRYNDVNNKNYHDILFMAQTEDVVTLGNLSKIFLDEKETEFSVNGVSQKRFDKIKASVEILVEIIGPHKSVADIDDDIIQTLRVTLSEFPSNIKKRFGSLPIIQAIAKSKEKGGATLSPLTQSNYLDVMRDILKLAVRKKFIHSNPAADVRPLKKEKLTADQKRLPWSPQQLKDFFQGDFYSRFSMNAQKPYSKPDRNWRFWLSLIMLLSGARPNEIAQLYVNDIKQTDKKTWYMDMDVSDGEHSKSLKNSSSRRRVPIHSELIEIGFLDFVGQRKKLDPSKGPRLFWEITPDKYGNFATYPARRLNEHFIPAETQLGARQSLYSLRHNVRDALRLIKAPPETLLAIAGWSPNGKAVSDDYGDPGNPDLHVDWVNKIAYDKLDLSCLYGAYKSS
ncbi:site-specific integrase [Brucella gallinifaecis]|uniref:DUF6538 domain-containing protein n=1 Tax=Brucella gallinifaecis TaxID=215590 RepID=UPI00235FBA1F|nr:site-specific integrase [Brucella gallinifaecis]